ncbi:MAG: hypothetical protein ACRCYQ_07655 [Nocardioides sp.]
MPAEKIQADFQAIQTLVQKVRLVADNVRTVRNELDDLWDPSILPPSMAQGSAAIINKLNQAMASLDKRANEIDKDADAAEQFGKDLREGELQDIAHYDQVSGQVQENGEQYAIIIK